MGANLSHIKYTPEPRKTETEIRAEIQADFRERQERARHEDGHDGYSGTIAELSGRISWHDRQLKNPGEVDSGWFTYDPDGNRVPRMEPRVLRDAEEYLSTHSEKRGAPLAVSFLYSPGKGKRYLKGWLVGGWCAE